MEIREVKLCLLGDSGVGKSSIVHRLMYNNFQPVLENTIGAAFFSKQVTVESAVFKYQIWDTAGQEKYRALTPMYFRGASVAIIVYDITAKETYDAVSVWICQLKQYANSDIVIAIAGNKCDMEEKRQIQFKDALEFAKSQGAIFVETSAKTAVNVATLFQEISECLARQIPSQTSVSNVSSPSTLNVVIPKSSSSSSRLRSCCS